MKIERLRIDAFGQFRSFERELGPGLNVLCGPNETGKSTLLAFIRAVLFGFPKRGEPTRYEPDQGAIGGELFLKTAGGAFWVRRAGSRRSEGELMLRTPEGERLPPSRLNDALGAISRELFFQVFAFGLHELSSFDALASEGTVSQALFAAGMLGARRLPFALSSLEKTSKALFVSRGSKAQLNSLFAELAEVVQRITSIGDRPRQYFEQRAELDALEQQLRIQSDARRTVELERDVLRELQAVLCRLAELGREKDDVQAKVRGLEFERNTLERVWIPEQSAARWRSALASFEARVEQWRTLEGRRKVLEDKEQALEAQLASLALQIAPTELVEREPQSAKRELELLRSELTNAAQQVAQAREACRSATDARAAAANEIEHLRSQIDGLPEVPGSEFKEIFPLSWALVTSGAFVTLGVIALYLSGLVLGTIALAGSFSFAGVVLLIQRRARRAFRASSADAAAKHLAQAEKRTKLLAELHQQQSILKQRLEEERWQTADLECAEQTLAQPRAGLRSLLQTQGLPAEISADAGLVLWADLGRIRQGLLDLREHRFGLVTEEQGCRTAANAVLEASTAAGLAPQEALGAAKELRDLLDRADRANVELNRVNHLVAECEQAVSRLARTAHQLEASVGRLRRQTELAADLNAQELLTACSQRLRALDPQLSELEARQRAIAERKGGIAKDLDAWEKDSELAQLRSREEFLRGRIGDLSQEYAIQRLAAGLLKHARWRHEREQQPKVIRLASQVFAELTAGRYACVYTQADAPETLFVADGQGREWKAEQLSRGTREQLYLAFRLAVIEDLGETRQALPVILDDILVNFDPERAQHAVRTLARVSKVHQVVAFTCHPSLRDLFQKHGAQLLSLAQKPVPLLESA